MDQLKPDLINNRILTTRNRIMQLLGVCIILFFSSCKNDIDKINVFNENLELPDQSGVNVEVEYTDSGKVQLKFITPKMERFIGLEEPYYEFPEGIKVLFYESMLLF